MSQLTPKQYARRLEALAKDELPGVYSRAINRVAQAADTAQRMGLRKDFKLRNKWTEGSLMLWRSKPNRDPAKINAIVGSKSDYLRVQEEGGTEVNRDGRPTMSMPTRKSRRGNWGKRVTTQYAPGAWGNVARRGPSGAMAPKGAKFFQLGPGQGAEGVNKRKTTTKWRSYRRTVKAGGKAKRPAKRFHDYKLKDEVIFTRTSGGRLIRVRRLLKTPVHLKATRWHSMGVAKVARLEVINAAFVHEADLVLRRLGAT